MVVLLLFILRLGVYFKFLFTYSTTNVVVTSNVIVVNAYQINDYTLKKRSFSLLSSTKRTSSFSYPSSSSSSSSSSSILLSSSIVPSDVEEDFLLPTKDREETDDDDDDDDVNILSSLKLQLIGLCATYDRGFGTSTSGRQTIDTLIQQIQNYNTVQIQLFLNESSSSSSSSSSTIPTNTIRNNFTIIGNWSMIYTTAFDVLSLQTSPLFIPGAIYQVYDESGTTGTSTTTTTTTSITTVTNIIDFIPRFQSLFVSILPKSSLFNPSPTTLIRAKVQTRVCVPPQTRPTMMNRIGLIFDSISIQPIELLGIDSTKLLPPLALDLPKLPTFGISSSSSSSTKNPIATGYFDVTYLDNDLLIIRQNAPGGIFCLLRTNTIDP